MAEVDWGLAAHPDVPKQRDPLETMIGLETYKSKSMDNHQKRIDINSLADYKRTRDARSLEGATPDLRATTLSGDNTEQGIKMKTMSTDAQATAGIDDPKLKKDFWNHKLDNYVKKGWVTPEDRARIGNEPRDDVLEHVIRNNMPVTDFRTSTGETAGAEATARMPTEIHKTVPGETARYPAQEAGGNLTPVGRALVPRGGRTQPPAGVVPAPAGAAPPAPGNPPAGSVNMTDRDAKVVSVEPIPPGAPTPRSASQSSKKGSNAYFDEVPSVPIGDAPASGRGIVQGGKDPLFMAARTDGFKKFNDTIAPTAAKAAKQQGTLSNMESELQSGKVRTDRLADIKMVAAGLIYGATRDIDTANKMTGVNLSSQEVLNKDTTRMGLQFSNETIGGREALQTVQIALQANPSMLNSEAGNLKVIQIMKQSNKYDMEMSKAAQAYLEKNQHLNGFENWWVEKHPPAQFLSKAVPYQVPTNASGSPDARGMQNGVTYEYKLNGKPEKGVWDASKMGFSRVEQ